MVYIPRHQFITRGFIVCSCGFPRTTSCAAGSKSDAGPLRTQQTSTIQSYYLLWNIICKSSIYTRMYHYSRTCGIDADSYGTKDSEKTKVLQAICSVIQALPPKDAIAPVEVRAIYPL